MTEQGAFRLRSSNQKASAGAIATAFYEAFASPRDTTVTRMLGGVFILPPQRVFQHRSSNFSQQ